MVAVLVVMMTQVTARRSRRSQLALQTWPKDDKTKNGGYIQRFKKPIDGTGDAYSYHAKREPQMRAGTP